MTAAIRSELVQLRTLRGTYGIGFLIVVLIVAVTVGDLEDAKELVTAQQMLAPILTGAGISVAFIGALFAATRVAGEYRYGTIAHRALAAPRRMRLLAAKLVTFSGLGLAAALAAVGVGLVTAVAVLHGKDLSLAFGAGDGLEVVARVVVAGTLFAALGTAVGFITRSQQVAVVVVFGEFFVEKLLGGLLGDLTNYLPFGLLDRLIDASAGNALAAGLVLSAITAGLVTVAGVLLNRRDINA